MKHPRPRNRTDPIMRIRWKLLVLFLAISLLPMLLMHFNSQRAMNLIHEDLSNRARKNILHRTSQELRRLVEDHARVMARERDILSLALTLQAAELERQFVQAATCTVPAAPAEPAPEPAFAPSPDHCRQRPGGDCVPFNVSYEAQTIVAPQGLDPEKAGADRALLETLTPVYRDIQARQPKLVFWQATALVDGSFALFPALDHLPRRMPMISGMMAGMPGDMMPGGMAQPNWLTRAVTAGTTVWMAPEIDPVTRQLVMTVARPVFDPEGRAVGATAIMVSVVRMLEENAHIRMISQNATSLLVKPETAADGSTTVRVLASEEGPTHQHGRWQTAEEPAPLAAEDHIQFSRLADDLSDCEAGVRQMLYAGVPSIWAYGCITPSGEALLLIIPTADVVADVVASETFISELIGDRIRTSGLILASAVVAIILLALVFSRYFTLNLDKLVIAFRRVAGGDFTSRVDIRTKDELQEVAATFNQMVPELSERMALKQALGLAQEVQQNLLPQSDPILPGLDIAGSSLYSDETGGDFYDYVASCCHRPGLAVAVGDVSGHGIAAALLMASTRAFLLSRAAQPGSLAEVMTDVNRLVASDSSRTSQFVTLFLLQLDPGLSSLSWVRAGHDPALVYDPATDAFTELLGPGLALGLSPDYAYAEGRLETLAPGQIVLLGTDGIWETMNAAGEMFGKKRLRTLIREHAAAPAAAIMTRIGVALAAFREEGPQADDVTMVVIKITGREEASQRQP